VIIDLETKYISTEMILAIDRTDPENPIRLGYVVEMNLETRKVKRLIDGIITEYPNQVSFEVF
jgi:hypothetical protein